MLNILAEEKIPFAPDAFENLGNVTLCNGNRLTAEDLKCIDILLIRSGTRVDQGLLDGTPVRFVASATVGTDHVDKSYLKERGIPFYHAPGCNADAVVEYVIAALLHLCVHKGEMLAGKKVGVIGAGNIGGRLVSRLPALGLEILVNDPPRFESDREGAIKAVSLEELLAEADIVTLHTPLTRSGAYPTFHLLDEVQLRTMKAGAWLINASRGPVLSNSALKAVLEEGLLGAVVLDVWENEPVIDVGLMELVDIATPHIAGHSYEGKVNGTIQIYDAYTRHFGVEGGWNPERILAPAPEDNLDLAFDYGGTSIEAALHLIVQQMYDIEADDRLFRESLEMQEEERRAFLSEVTQRIPPPAKLPHALLYTKGKD